MVDQKASGHYEEVTSKRDWLCIDPYWSTCSTVKSHPSTFHSKCYSAKHSSFILLFMHSHTQSIILINEMSAGNDQFRTFSLRPPCLSKKVTQPWNKVLSQMRCHYWEERTLILMIWNNMEIDFKYFWYTAVFEMFQTFFEEFNIMYSFCSGIDPTGPRIYGSPIPFADSTLVYFATVSTWSIRIYSEPTIL